MFCRTCLCKNVKVYYKLNNKYIDLLETITESKMKLNDLVCCFCLATLRKIEKFTAMVKEVDSILKKSIKTEEDENEVNKYHNLVVSTDKNISIECSTALHETYACNIRDELLRQVERDLVKMEETEDTVVASTRGTDEPLHSSRDTTMECADNGTNSANDMRLLTVTVFKEEHNEYIGESDEPHQLSEDTIIDNEIYSEDDVPLITIQHIRGESEKLLNDLCDDDTTETKGGYILKPLKICLRRVDEDIGLIEQRREEHSGQQPTFNNNINYEPSTRKQEQNIHELNEKNNVDRKLAASDKQFSCYICAYRSRSKKVLSRHLRAHTEAVLPKKLKSSSSKEKFKIVTELPREEVVEQDINRKRRNKSNKNVGLPNEIKEKVENETSRQNCDDAICDKPFSCDTCTYRTNCKYTLKRHLLTHTGEKPFSCNICFSKFRQESHLIVHLRTHTGDKPFSCNICLSKFRQKSNLTDHLQTHTGETPFWCNICSYKCGSKGRLTKHLRTHTGEKPYSCNICSYQSRWKKSLEVHLRRHTGEKPYSCNICFSKFRQKQCLTEHLRRHTGEKLYSCNICSFKSSWKKSLENHLRRHTGEKPFSCNICFYKFRQKSNLLAHLRTHR